MKAKKDRHPAEDAIEDFTEWTVTGERIDMAIARIPKPGHPHPSAPPPAKKEESEDEYIARRCEEYMHKSLSCRRGNGGKSFTIGGGGDGGVAFQVI